MFLAHEIEEMKELIPENERKNAEDLKMYLSDHVYNFLKQSNRLKTITDQVNVFPSNKYRPYTSIRITKFFDENTDFFTLLENILNSLNGGFLIFCDFHFIMTGSAKDAGEESDFLGDNLKLQTASKMSHLNETVTINTEKDAANIIAQFRSMSSADLLNAAFLHHTDFYEYQSSGLRPYQLLSAVFHLQKFNE